MNANTFNDYYGQHIARVQQNALRRTLPAWPYIIPRLPDAGIAIQDSGIKRHFVPCGIHYDWYLSGVIYRAGMITYVPLPYWPYAAISFEFSGCYMAKLCFRGDWYAFHIATSTTPADDCKQVWKDFLALHKQDITTFVMCRPTSVKDLFDKYAELHYKRSRSVMLAGLIAEDNQCYTLVYDYDSAQVAKMQPDNVRTDLIRTCSPELLCHEADRNYFTQLMNKNKLWVDSGAEKKTARRPCRI